jgi:hypothetical protein
MNQKRTGHASVPAHEFKNAKEHMLSKMPKYLERCVSTFEMYEIRQWVSIYRANGGDNFH